MALKKYNQFDAHSRLSSLFVIFIGHRCIIIYFYVFKCLQQLYPADRYFKSIAQYICPCFYSTSTYGAGTKAFSQLRPISLQWQLFISYTIKIILHVFKNVANPKFTCYWRRTICCKLNVKCFTYCQIKPRKFNCP